jgi:MFS family permease
MSHKLRLPHYFAKRISRQISELYAATAIADLGIAIIMLFEPIFLYSVLKFSIQEVLLFFAAVYAIYIVIIPFGAKIASRFGYEHSILFSIPFQILYWFLILGAKDNMRMIYLAPLAFAIEKALFWPAFHAIISRFARDEQRGREFSLLYGIFNLMHIIGPFIGGFLADRYGLTTTFIVAAAIYFCSFIPLFTTREVFTPRVYKWSETWELYKTYPLKFLGYFGFGEELLVLTIWPIFLYIVIKNYEETGLVVTLATFIATILALYIGKVTDRQSKTLMIKIGSFISMLVWGARLVVGTTFAAFIVDSLSRTGKDLVFIPLSTVTYERAESNRILPYVVGFEQALSVGKFLAAVLGIIVFTMTGSFAALFLLAAVFTLLYILI